MDSQKRCVVTGLGLVCGIGNNVEECWTHAINGESGIADVKSFDTENCYSHKGAEVELTNEELSDESYDRSSLLCIKAAKEALADAGYLPNVCKHANDIGVILGSCVGGAASIDKYYSEQNEGKASDSSDIIRMSASSIANNVSKHFGFSGVMTFFE